MKRSYLPIILWAFVLIACGSGSSNSPGDEYSSRGGASSQAYSSSVASSSSVTTDSMMDPVVGVGPQTLSLLKAHNPGLFQDVHFTLQDDSSYSTTLAPEVDLSGVVPSFEYTGNVSMAGVLLQSEITKIAFSDSAIVMFDDKPVLFRIVRRHAIPSLSITTLNGTSIDTGYVVCSLRLDGKNLYADYASTDAQIRLRGNSTRIFYDKKPYRIKLGAKSALLGMKEDKDWVLLANYRDPTNFMNAVVFDMARYMQMPYVNSNRFVELTVNGEYVGMYQFTEQIEQGTNRVAVDELTGVLLSLDLDDGPELAPHAGNNFNSTIYNLPVCIKNPKTQTAEQIAAIQADFAALENLVESGPYNTLATRLDIASAIDFLIIQELTRNVELVSPRSMYLYKGADNIYHYGPVWDFDGGFAFDWASMENGHNYFGSQSWLMGSTNPSTHPRDAYNTIPGFFVDLFAYPEFVAAYQARWNALNPGMWNAVFAQLDGYALQAGPAMASNAARWPIGLSPANEIQRMKSWLQARTTAYTRVVQKY